MSKSLKWAAVAAQRHPTRTRRATGQARAGLALGLSYLVLGSENTGTSSPALTQAATDPPTPKVKQQFPRPRLDPWRTLAPSRGQAAAGRLVEDANSSSRPDLRNWPAILPNRAIFRHIHMMTSRFSSVSSPNYYLDREIWEIGHSDEEEVQTKGEPLPAGS